MTNGIYFQLIIHHSIIAVVDKHPSYIAHHLIVKLYTMSDTHIHAVRDPKVSHENYIPRKGEWLTQSYEVCLHSILFPFRCPTHTSSFPLFVPL